MSVKRPKIQVVVVKDTWQHAQGLVPTGHGKQNLNDDNQKRRPQQSLSDNTGNQKVNSTYMNNAYATVDWECLCDVLVESRKPNAVDFVAQLCHSNHSTWKIRHTRDFCIALYKDAPEMFSYIYGMYPIHTE